MVLLGRIEEGLRTDTKVVPPRGYHARADYVDVLIRKGWGKGQIERITGWNMCHARVQPNAIITNIRHVNVEAVPAGTEIHGVAGPQEATRMQAVVLSAGALKIVIEGYPESIEAIAGQMMESARVMRGDAPLREVGA